MRNGSDPSLGCFQRKTLGVRNGSDIRLGCFQEKVTLGMRNGSDPSLGCFQEKVTLPKHGAGSGGEKDTMTFSLWRWLHSIINLLVDTLKDPWVDGCVLHHTAVQSYIQAPCIVGRPLASVDKTDEGVSRAV